MLPQRNSARLSGQQATLSDYLTRSKQASPSPAPAKSIVVSNTREETKVAKGVEGIVEETKPPTLLSALPKETVDDEEPPAFPEDEEASAPLISEQVSAKINALRGKVAKADVTLASWISKRTPSDDSSDASAKKRPKPLEIEDEKGPLLPTPPPLDQVSDAAAVLPTQTPIKYVPAIQSQHAVLAARKLGIPFSALKLPLSPEGAFLDALLGHLDHAISLAQSRGQPTVFARLLPSLERVMGKRITAEHLEQICALWPEAFQREPCWTIAEGRKIRSERLTLNAGDAIERRVRFRWVLIQRLAEAHRDFCQRELGLPEADVGVASLEAWHPRFALNEGCSLKQHQRDAPSLLQTPSPSTEEADNRESPSKQPPAVVGSLLERIKAKQATAELAKIKKQGEASPESILDQKRRSLCAIIDRLVILYASTRKSSLSMQFVLERLATSPPLTQAHLETLHGILPKWLHIVHADEALKQGPLIVRIDRSQGTRDLKASVMSAKKLD